MSELEAHSSLCHPHPPRPLCLVRATACEPRPSSARLLLRACVTAIADHDRILACQTCHARKVPCTTVARHIRHTDLIVGSMRCCQSRGPLHQLRGLPDRMSHPNPQAKEDSEYWEPEWKRLGQVVDARPSVLRQVNLLIPGLAAIAKAPTNDNGARRQQLLPPHIHAHRPCRTLQMEHLPRPGQKRKPGRKKSTTAPISTW